MLSISTEETALLSAFQYRQCSAGDSDIRLQVAEIYEGTLKASYRRCMAGDQIKESLMQKLMLKYLQSIRPLSGKGCSKNDDSDF